MPLVLALVLGVLAVPAAASVDPPDTDTFEQASRTAMTSYYAALLTSVHGDAEATLRQLLLLKSKWEEVARQSRPGGPRWTQGATTGASPLATVADIVEQARRLTIRGDVAGAHAKIEGIRAVLREARARHGVRTFDDMLTDYHEAMERLTSRVGLRNEISLNAEDHVAIRLQATRARAAWSEIMAVHNPVTALPGWTEVTTRTTTALVALEKAAIAEDGLAAQEAAAAMRTHYLELLRILSRG
jgi:hypothetical protein